MRMPRTATSHLASPLIQLAALMQTLAWSALGGQAPALVLPEGDHGTTYHVSPKGGDQNAGTEKAPWTSIARAAGAIKPGDEVIVHGGVYPASRLEFGPPGTGPERYTVFKAAPGERPVFTRPDGLPPAVSVASYTQVEGLWLGGTWQDKNGFVGVGGSPVSRGVRLIRCTLWGYSDGIGTGSAEDLLVHGCRLVRCGWGRFSHGIYLSGGYTKGAMTQHVVLDSNTFVHGQGYALHGWHNPHSCILTRNFTYGYYWGLVYGSESTDGLIAHNILWKPTGQPGHEPSTGFWIPGRRITFANNLVHAAAPCFGGPAGESHVRANAYLTNQKAGALPAFDTRPVGLDGKPLGLAEGPGALDAAAAKIDKLFSRSAEDIQRNAEVETLFAAFSGKVVPNGPLYRTGVDLKLPCTGKAPNIGRDTPSWKLADLYRSFDALGMKHYNNVGEPSGELPAGWKYALNKQR